MTTLTDPQRAFLDRPLNAIVATLGPEGMPSQSVVWYVRDGDALWISVRPDSVKARHVAHDPRLSLLVITPDGGGYLRIDGEAKLAGEVDLAARRVLIGRYIGVEKVEDWLASHPLPSPNARLLLRPTRVAAHNIGG